MPGAVEEFAVELGGGVEAAAGARRAVQAHAPDLPEPLQGDVLLLVTELVTNAVLHGRVGPDGSVLLECRRAGDRLRFLVSERDRELRSNGAALTLAPQSTNGNGRPSGWGLVLVDRIAEQWGVLDGRPGTCVWFEVSA
jgi:anti-sigma regulatory factor (Ser/Thr protein kinase)